jgi:hypothetical protein
MFLRGLLISIGVGAVLVFCLKLIYNISEKHPEKGGIQLLDTERALQQEEFDSHDEYVHIGG